MFRETWKKTFYFISYEENLNFDENNERRVDQFINENIIRTKLFETANIDRLNINNELTKSFAAQDMINITIKFKNKALYLALTPLISNFFFK